MTARTVRLPPALFAEADAYAASLGISFNALAAVALRDYLYARGSLEAGTPTHAPEVHEQPTAVRPSQEPTSPPRHAPPARAGAGGPKVGRNDPCPCGSGQKFKRCCGGAS